MKNIGFLLLLTALLFGCRKAEINAELKGSKWLEQGGDATIQFAKRWVKVDGEKINDKGETVYVENGQIWIDKDGVNTYVYDYKLSGTNLFVLSESTSVFVDPSFIGIKYKQD